MSLEGVRRIVSAKTGCIRFRDINPKITLCSSQTGNHHRYNLSISMHRVRLFFKYLLIVGFSAAFLGAALIGGLLYYLVVLNPGPEMDAGYIASILGRESPVFYSNGTDKIGVLFEDQHRQYLPYNQIPQSFINAIVAAEDDGFFTHYGIDPAGIARAMLANYKAGRIVQGGSTITQQTAKNLFKRESRSYKAKLKELLFALRLEYHFSKAKILEFYCNQFYVSGNGHGLGVAARYYFDKTPLELTTLESAFIAGSVKRPNYYNPFIKKDLEGAEKARRRAEARAGYVLRKMYENGTISEYEYDYARTSDIVFNQGKTSFSFDTVMDLVKEGLSTPEIRTLLEDHGISNVSTSGVRIITSIDHDVQQQSLAALRHELSRLDVQLRGYHRQEVQQEYNQTDYEGDFDFKESAFVFGTIAEIKINSAKGLRITVDFGPKKDVGIIDRKGIERLLQSQVKYHKKSWDKATDKDLPLLLNELQSDDRVYVSIREILPDGSFMLELERFPQLEGAALVMQHGAIRAMVGGMENRFYNRAIHAKRLMGSTFKPFLFSAALQLGWNATDLLDNQRGVYVFQGAPYFPRPDHISPFAQVSLSWTGIKSENLAAVWLLDHLTDRLTPPELRDLAKHLDMAPRIENGDEESYNSFKRRIRDEYGIVVNQNALDQAAYDQAVRNMETDMIFEGRSREYEELKHLPYGLYFDAFHEDIQKTIRGGKHKRKGREELALRLDILQKNFLALTPTREILTQRKQVLYDALSSLGFLSFFTNRPIAGNTPGYFYEKTDGRIGFTLNQNPSPDTFILSNQNIFNRLKWMGAEKRKTFFDDIVLEDVICCCLFDEVSRRMEEEKKWLYSSKPYSMEVLATVHDYRVMLGLQYLRDLAQASGIGSPTQPVLSFPLGSNVISLFDAVNLYETMVTGSRYATNGELQHPDPDSDEETDPAGLSLIERIESFTGEILYSRETAARTVFDLKTRNAVNSILQNTVQYGTGNYAHKTVRLHSSDPEKEQELQSLNIPVPLLGKTGTANSFRNSAFLGYVPVLSDTGTMMSVDNGYAVGVYVGFDDNRPMARGTTRISGSSGSLPTWAKIADALLQHQQTGERVDTVDLSFSGLGLRYPGNSHLFISADPERGGNVSLNSRLIKSEIAPDDSLYILTYGKEITGGRFQPERFFNPYYKGYLE